MTQITLSAAVGMLNSMTKQKDENFCDGKKHNPLQSGDCVIDSIAKAKASPRKLLSSMKKHKKQFLKNKQKSTDFEPEVPTKPTRKSGRWDVARCGPDVYPWQTHHLIPKKFLPTQQVCEFLSKDYKEGKNFILEENTRYSTDHSNNGYCLPFVSTTYQWKKANGNEEAEGKVAQEMMRLTGKQLHQGNHSDQEDFLEEDDIETKPYLESVRKLLKRIYSNTTKHAKKCDQCKGGEKEGKTIIQPLHKVVEQMDVASLIIKLRIEGNIIFVSKRSYEYYKP